MCAKRKQALGRGLGALLNDTPPSRNSLDKSEDSSPLGSYINEIFIDEVEVNPYQPRQHFDETALEELSESIKTQGIIQPITVRRVSENSYQLISGERRLQASKKAKLKRIPAYIRLADDQQMLEMALIENIQRENLNAVEIALSYQRLITECNLKQEELGDRVGKKRSTVNNYIRLLKLPPDIQVALRDNLISMGHARALITIENIETQLNLFKQVIKEELSVRKTEELVREHLLGKSKGKQSPSKNNQIQNEEISKLQNQLTSHFGTKISIKSNGNKGQIQIPFMSTDDLNRILDLLKV